MEQPNAQASSTQQPPASEVDAQDRDDDPLFPHDFGKLSKFGLLLNPHSYCFYRIVMLLVNVALFTLLLLYGPELRNFAYLTYWGFTASFVYFFVGAAECVLMRTINSAPDLGVWKWLHFLYMNLLGVELMINGVFWGVFFPFILAQHRHSGVPFNKLDMTQAIGAHLVPLTMLLIDGCNNLVCFWNRHPRRYLIAIMLFYLAFNMVYTFEMGPIYPVMTYRDYLTYVFVAGNVVGAFFCYEVMFFISRKLKNHRVAAILEGTETLNRVETINHLRQNVPPNSSDLLHQKFVEENNRVQPTNKQPATTASSLQ